MLILAKSYFSIELIAIKANIKYSIYVLEKIVVINKYKIKIVYIKLLLFFNLIDLMPENAMIPKYKAKTYIPPEHKISIIVLLKPKLKLLQLDINCVYAVLFNPDPIIG